MSSLRIRAIRVIRGHLLFAKHKEELSLRIRAIRVIRGHLLFAKHEEELSLRIRAIRVIRGHLLAESCSVRREGRARRRVVQPTQTSLLLASLRAVRVTRGHLLAALYYAAA